MEKLSILQATGKHYSRKYYTSGPVPLEDVLLSLVQSLQTSGALNSPQSLDLPWIPSPGQQQGFMASFCCFYTAV